MAITLRPEHEQLVAEALRSGAYQSPDEVIKRALELLHERDAWLAENRAKIAEGYAFHSQFLRAGSLKRTGQKTLSAGETRQESVRAVSKALSRRHPLGQDPLLL